MHYFQVGENDRLKRRIYLHLVDATDGITPETGEAGGSAKVSLNGNAPTTSVNTLVAVDSTNQPGTYYLELSQSEIQFPGVVIVRYKSANTAEFVSLGQVMAFDPYTQFGTLGGGGSDVDYKRIKKLVEEAVSSIPQPIEPKEPDLIPISEGLQAVIQEIRDIKYPEQKDTDLMPLIVKMEVMQRFLNNFKMPECDHKEVMKKLDRQDEMMEAHMRDIADHVEETLAPVRNVLSNDNEQVKDDVRKLGEKLDDIQYVVVEKKPKETKKSVLEEYLNLT
jgi:hypothetical protein